MREKPDFRPVLVFLEKPGRTHECLAGREDSNLYLTNSKSVAVACSRGVPKPLFVEFHKLLETFEFREPYRIFRVQSFGEEWAIRRKMSRLCRLGVRSPNEKIGAAAGLNCQ